jgi:hypothetical protein
MSALPSPSASRTPTSYRRRPIARVPLPGFNVYRDRLLGAVAHGDGDQDQAAIAREQARACGLE